MSGTGLWKLFTLLCLTAFLIAAPQLSAQDLDDFGELNELGGDDFGGDDFSDLGGDDSLRGDGMVAESPSTENAVDTQKMSESEQVDDLAVRFTFKPDRATKDPFKPLVEKKVVLPPVRKVRPVSRTKNSKPKPPPIKPIKLHVAGIVGNEGARLAVIKFENEEHTISKDQVVEGKFKVVDILSDRVVVYSNKEKRRHTFKIGGEDQKKR
jgi:hypothetical protein